MGTIKIQITTRRRRKKDRRKKERKKKNFSLRKYERGVEGVVLNRNELQRVLCPSTDNFVLFCLKEKVYIIYNPTF